MFFRTQMLTQHKDQEGYSYRQFQKETGERWQELTDEQKKDWADKMAAAEPQYHSDKALFDARYSEEQKNLTPKKPRGKRASLGSKTAQDKKAKEQDKVKKRKEKILIKSKKDNQGKLSISARKGFVIQKPGADESPHKSHQRKNGKARTASKTIPPKAAEEAMEVVSDAALQSSTAKQTESQMQQVELSNLEARQQKISKDVSKERQAKVAYMKFITNLP